MKLEHPFSVAIVDDHLLLRKVLRNYFSSCGIHVMYEAGNGKELLDQLIDEQKMPDTVLLDIDMPVMNGYETARFLKTAYPEIAILAYSSSNDPARVDTIIENGADLFMKKNDHPILYVQALSKLHENNCMIG